jgi:hypothetical protein
MIAAARVQVREGGWEVDELGKEKETWFKSFHFIDNRLLKDTRFITCLL